MMSVLCVTACGATVAFPEPLIAQSPLGGLIYNGAVSGAIQSGGDTVSFTLPVNANETITVDVHPDANLQPTIAITDPANNVIGVSTAAAVGQEDVLQTVPADITGTYTITVSGATNSTGNFTVQVTLNAALDLAAHGGPENNTLATAQDISVSSFPLTATADRMAVVGHFEGTDDFYSFSLQAGQFSTIALSLASSASVALQLEDGNDVLASGVSGTQNVSLIIHNFVAPAAATYFARLTGTGQSDYSLIVTRSADFEQEPDDQAHAQSLVGNHQVLGDIGNGGSSRDTDWYAFNVNAGDALTLSTATPSDQGGEFHNNLIPQIDLYDNNVNRVATNAAKPKNTPVTWTALTTGTYFARISGAKDSKHTIGEYVLDVQGATGP